MVRWGAERGTDRHRERVVQGSVDVKARPFPRGLRFPTGRWARGVSRALSPISPRHGERPIPKGKSPLVYTGSSTLVSVFYPVRFTSRTEPTRSLTVLLFPLPLDSLDAYPAERDGRGRLGFTGLLLCRPKPLGVADGTSARSHRRGRLRSHRRDACATLRREEHAMTRFRRGGRWKPESPV